MCVKVYICMYMEVDSDFGLSAIVCQLMVSDREARAKDNTPVPTEDMNRLRV